MKNAKGQKREVGKSQFVVGRRGPEIEEEKSSSFCGNDSFLTSILTRTRRRRRSSSWDPRTRSASQSGTRTHNGLAHKKNNKNSEKNILEKKIPGSVADMSLSSAPHARVTLVDLE